MSSPEKNSPRKQNRTPAQDGRYERAFTNKIPSLQERIFAQPAEKRNFECVLGYDEEKGEGAVTLLQHVEDGNDKYAKFSQLLLPGYRLDFGMASYVDPDEEVVVLNPDDLDDKGGVLAALQLFAMTYEQQGYHLNLAEKIIEYVQMVPRLQKEKRVNDQLYKEKEQDLADAKPEKRENELAQFREMLAFSPWPDESAGSPKFRRLAFEDASRRIRGSWVRAVLWANGFEQAGFSVLSEFQSVDEIVEYIALHLTEQEVSMRQGEVFFEDKPLKLKQPYVRPNQSEKYFEYRRPDIYPRKTE